MNRAWLERMMKKHGISYYSLKRVHHFSPDTLLAWEDGTPARIASLRKLAAILDVNVRELIAKLGVKVQASREAKALLEK
jgi:hypothetical protein